MSESIYWLILLIVDGLMLFMGLHLLFGIVPDELKGSLYHKARRYVGVAFTVTPIVGFLFYMVRLNQPYTPDTVTAVNLTAYFIVGVLMSFAFISITDVDVDVLKMAHKFYTTCFVIFFPTTWSQLFIEDKDIVFICHIVSNIELGLMLLASGWYVSRMYKKFLEKINDYFSDNVEVHIKWIERSLSMFAGLALIACVSPFASHYSLWFALFYVSYQFVVYIYLYDNILRFEHATLKYLPFINDVIDDAINHITPKYVQISQEKMEYISVALNEWIEKKGYLCKELTVKSVASQIYTNRTYLSSYINSTYHLTFKTWTTQLRIEEAKRVLLENSNNSLDEISSQLGFSSTSSFVNAFKKIENTTPHRWQHSRCGLES